MTTVPDPAPAWDGQSAALRSAYEMADLTFEQLWMRYFALGGNADLVEMEGHLAGLMPLPPAERDLLAHAVNERLDELFAQRRVPYSRPIRSRRPLTGPLAALLHLIDASHTAPPDRVGTLAAEAGRALGVQVTVHVVDHEQRRLWRLPTQREPAEPADERLAVDGTLPGRVYQTVQMLPSESGGVPRLWVPVIDGSDRLGVLEVGLNSPAELHDPTLREQCRWLADMLGYLITAMGKYGDALERRRRTRPRSPAAELLWQQLPPLTAASDAFMLAGWLEPAYEVGGDAFDYALSEETVSLAIFDAMGHGLGAGLLAAASLSAYRSARRDGGGIHDQARRIDDVVAGTFPGSAFATGVLAELDVATGRLRYVNGGHPPPLLLREGKVVKELSGGRRIPFGLGDGTPTVAEESLQPGDWLTLYTDGVTEARDASGAWFGEQRLVEFLTHQFAAGQPPPETARRLMRAVLDHQHGLLQDDASILLARWARDAPR
ncbi:MAG TPA: PP2C family protein-serine/threonine phosphatase [Geodermatophilus sp.]|nr:PP2C family protein-serine/threonine phosphatase [Geodermatophilus sp.]